MEKSEYARFKSKVLGRWAKRIRREKKTGYIEAGASMKASLGISDKSDLVVQVRTVDGYSEGGSAIFSDKTHLIENCEMLDIKQSIDPDHIYMNHDEFYEDLKNVLFNSIDYENRLTKEQFIEIVDSIEKLYNPYWKKVSVLVVVVKGTRNYG